MDITKELGPMLGAENAHIAAIVKGLADVGETLTDKAEHDLRLGFRTQAIIDIKLKKARPSAGLSLEQHKYLSDGIPTFARINAEIQQEMCSPPEEPLFNTDELVMLATLLDALPGLLRARPSNELASVIRMHDQCHEDTDAQVKSLEADRGGLLALLRKAGDSLGPFLCGNADKEQWQDASEVLKQIDAAIQAASQTKEPG